MVYQVGILDGDIQQASFAGSQVMCYGRFIEVAAVVQLMAQVGIFFPALLSCPWMQLAAVFGNGAVGIQVTIRLLRFADVIDQRVQLRFQVLVRIGLQGEAGSFYYFVDVRIVKGIFCFKFPSFSLPAIRKLSTLPVL